MGKTTDKCRTGRIHPLCSFYMSQPPQRMLKQTARCATTCGRRGQQVPEEVTAPRPIPDYMVRGYTGPWEDCVRLPVIPDASTIAPPINSLQFACPLQTLNNAISFHLHTTFTLYFAITLGRHVSIIVRRLPTYEIRSKSHFDTTITLH
jgi:hypothetical protein